MITSADAALLVSGFQSESKSLAFIFVGKAFTSRLTATVSEFVEGSHLALAVPGAQCRCMVDLRGCHFSYGDAREAPEAIREAVEANVAGILGIALPTGEYVFAVDTHSQHAPTGALLDWFGSPLA
jgi:hypothetical protein